MYSKTNLGATQLARRPLSPRRKRALAGAGIVAVLGLGGIGAWVALSSDAYTGSGAGCVNVTVPNSTGGATLHYCGSDAKSFCRDAFRESDQISLRGRPQCRQAGLAQASP